MRLYGAFTKAEVQSDGSVRVEGIASSEAIDDQGEIIKAEAIRAAIPNYMLFPALREMHQLSAAGTTLEAEVGDDGMTRIVGHVVDPVAVSKVKNQVYRGFSIGGRVTSRDSDNKKIITGLQLNEISLVDRPSNPEATFDCWKSEITEGLTDMPGLATIGDTPAGEKLAAAMNPVQIWACAHPEHRHVGKTEAVKCLEDDATAKAAVATEAAAEVADEGETSGTPETPEPTEKATADAPAEAETAVEATEETATEAEAETGVEKRGAEAADAAQAVIDAATAAMERGEAVLAEPEDDAAKSAADPAAAELPTELLAGADDTADDTAKADKPKGEYGDVEYADPGLQDDKKPRYPIDTAAHIRAAWSYINQEKNCAKYSAGGCAKVKAKIVAAWKSKIDKDGPPSESEKTTSAQDLSKSLYTVQDLADVIMFLDNMCDNLKWEAMVEGDNSGAPAEAKTLLAAACAFLRSQVQEETAEIMAGTDIEYGEDDGATMMWASVGTTLQKMAALSLELGSTDNPGQFDALAEALIKAGAKHSARDQMLLDAAYTCCTKAMGMDGCTKVQKAAFGDAKECVGAVGAKGFGETATKAAEGIALTMMIERFTKGGAHQALADMAHDAISRVTKAAACTMGKVGSRHSKETMDLLGKAHGLLCVAGANCDVTKDGDMGDTVDMAASVGDLAKTEDGQVTELTKSLEIAQAEKASLAKTLSEIVPLLDRLSKRVEDIALAPMPPMVVRRGGASISKTEDGGGSDEQPMTSDQIAAAIAKMSQNEVDLLPFKVAHRKPLYIKGLHNAPEIRERTGR